MRRRIVCSVAALIAVLATPATPSTTTPPEFEDAAEAVRWYRMAAERCVAWCWLLRERLPA